MLEDVIYKVIFLVIIIFIGWSIDKIMAVIRLGRLRHVFPVSDVNMWKLISEKDRTFSVRCSIVSPKLPEGDKPKTIRKYVHSAEVLALSRLMRELRPGFIALNMDNFYGNTSTFEDSNLLLLGLNRNNKLTESILLKLDKYTKGRVRYVQSRNGHPYFSYKEDNANKKKCCCDSVKEEQTQQVHKDCGVIIRAPRPGSNNKVVLILGGIHMHGTLAATILALDKKFQKSVKKEKYFVKLIEVSVPDGINVENQNINSEKYQLVPISTISS